MADKRLRTMVFPGLEDTYTIPQDMNDLESIDAVADPYDEFASYSIGDYCSNGGKLYRCNTAIPSGETWNANHWTETNVGDEILAEKAATSTALSGKVSKAGDTMTGGLKVKGPFATNESGSTQYIGDNFQLVDKNGVLIGQLRSRRDSDGTESTDLMSVRNVNGTDVYNNLRLRISPNGTRSIGISEAAEWVSALGFGKLGANQYEISGNSSVDIPLAASEDGFIVTIGSSEQVREFIFYHTGSSGNASSTQLRNVSQLTVTAGSYKITIANNSSAKCVCMRFKYVQ